MKKIISLTILLSSLMALHAQVPRISYFMDKYANRHQRNPALSPAWGYISVPALGYIDVGTESNFKLSTFLYPLKNGGLGTFMHPEVNADDFLSKVKKGNSFNFDFGYNPIGFGFYIENDKFLSFDITLKGNVGFNIPYDFFAFFKKGMSTSNTNYNIKDMNVVANAYAEFALGYAQNLSEKLRIGGKLKFLAGAADARLMVDNMAISMTPTQWTINTQATATVLGKGISFKDSAGIVKGLNPLENLGVGGFGGAIDLGASYNLDELLPIQGFTVSAGITDLGFIKYPQAHVQQAQTKGSVIYKGFENIQIGDSAGININFDDLKDQFMNMIELHQIPANSAVTRYLRSTLNAGLEYSFLEDKMSAGLLLSSHFGLPKTFTDVTLSYNLRPVNWFALSLSTTLAQGAFKTIGWALNFTPKYGLNLFLGSDYTFFEVTPQFVPINTSNVNVHFGLSVPLGRNRSKKYMPSESEDTPEAINDRTLSTD